MSDLIITPELMATIKACTGTPESGPDFFTAQNLWGKTETEVLAAMSAAGMAASIEWWNKQKTTEVYVRATAKEITMLEKYQVFDPISGTYTAYTSLEEAKLGLAAVAKEFLATSNLHIGQGIQNEYGDTAWTGLGIPGELVVTVV